MAELQTQYASNAELLLLRLVGQLAVLVLGQADGVVGVDDQPARLDHLLHHIRIAGILLGL